MITGALELKPNASVEVACSDSVGLPVPRDAVLVDAQVAGGAAALLPPEAVGM